jgi:hypothetical protein
MENFKEVGQGPNVGCSAKEEIPLSSLEQNTLNSSILNKNLDFPGDYFYLLENGNELRSFLINESKSDRPSKILVLLFVNLMNNALCL